MNTYINLENQLGCYQALNTLEFQTKYLLEQKVYQRLVTDLYFQTFYNKHTSPTALEYNSAVQLKDQTTTYRIPKPLV